MNEKRFQNELRQLRRLKDLLDGDIVLPLRIQIERKSLDSRKLEVTLTGITSLVGPSHQSCSSFTLSTEISPEHPNVNPTFRFLPPIPFHPHVWIDRGAICWGTRNTLQKDLCLVDWVLGVIEFLQFNQDVGCFLVIDRNSLANKDAWNWLESNKRNLARYVPRIDMARLRYFVNQAHDIPRQ